MGWIFLFYLEINNIQYGRGLKNGGNCFRTTADHISHGILLVIFSTFSSVSNDDL